MQVVSQSSKLLAPMAVNAVKVLCDEDPSKKNVDLNFIKMVKVLGMPVGSLRPSNRDLGAVGLFVHNAAFSIRRKHR